MRAGTFLPTARNLGLASLLFAAPLAAQTGLGVVRGTVQDASKAIIPNVKVTLTNADTGVVHETQTNTSGIYYFGAVEIGKYSLVAEAQGFKKWEGTFTVEAGQTLVIDPGMEVGSLQSAVEVTSAAPIIATEGGQVSDVKDALAIHDLPLNQRQISQLFSLTPGVVGDSSGNGSPRTNGMKAGSTEMNLDGISYVDRLAAVSRVCNQAWTPSRSFGLRLPAQVLSTRVPPRSSWLPGVAPMRSTVPASKYFAITRMACAPAQFRTATLQPS